ncbi:MAG: O-antigen polysaccharide polymerase Wzy [Acutalibacteraceae bacterium]
MTFVCVGQLTEVLPMPSNTAVTLESLAVFLIVNAYFLFDKTLKLFGLTHVHLLYASISAFGVGWICYFVGRDSVYETISVYSAAFLDSPMYAKAIVLSMLAFLVYILGVIIGKALIKPAQKNREINELEDRYLSKILANIGIAFIGMMFVAFAALMVMGRISLTMSYEQFRAAMEGSTLYAYLLLFYEAGICFVVACGNTTQVKIGVTLFSIVAIAFFLTGNKGEVLYGLLACIGILRYKGAKIKVKYVVALCILAFFVIPFVTATRKMGVIGSLSCLDLNFTGFFVELGTQVRCTVYVLEQMFNGSRELIWGFSYFNPIVNIVNRLIPFVDLSMAVPASFDFKTAFASMGFNQIAEGYANFGAIGSCLYFFITGLFLSKNEGKKLSNAALGYFGAICAILINVSRNKFAFFFGQVLIISVVYFAARKIAPYRLARVARSVQANGKD